MSKLSRQIADAERQVEQVQAMLDQAQRALETAARADAAVNRAKRPAAWGATVIAGTAATIVIVRLVMRQRQGAKSS